MSIVSMCTKSHNVIKDAGAISPLFVFNYLFNSFN